MLTERAVMKKRIQFTIAACLTLGAFTLRAEDWPMWGRTPHRNMVTDEKGVPTEWDVETGKNIKWTAQLGSQSYGNPVVAGGLVTVGTNNENNKDPRTSAGDASRV